MRRIRRSVPIALGIVLGSVLGAASVAGVPAEVLPAVFRAARAEDGKGAGGPAPLPPVVVARPDDGRPLRVGERAADPLVTFADGSSKRLSAAAGKAGLLVVARSETCPVGRRYGPTLAAIEKTAATLGFGVLYVNVASGDAAALAAEARTAAETYGFSAPCGIDADRAVARAFRLRTTTEVVLLDAARTVVYRGAVDDQYGVGVSRKAPTRTFLLDALRSVAKGERPIVEATTAPGCVLDLGGEGGGAAPTDPAAAAPTWHGRISRIVDRNCTECHRAGENGPFPLVTHGDVKAQREMIRAVVENGTMPPWFATEESGPFLNDRRLSARDREDVLRWIDAGCPVGDPAEAGRPEVREPGWKIGRPDVVLTVDRPFEVPASGTVEYQYRWVKASFPEDRWVRSVEVRPSAPEVVHHVLVFARFQKSDPRAKSQGPFDGGLMGFFAAMVPGAAHIRWEDGRAKKLPAGTDLLFQIHYTPIGRAVSDQPSIGLVFADGPPAEEVRTRGVFDTKFEIPPGAERHPVRGVYTLPQAGRVLEFMPHMHLRGTAFRYEVELPEGERRTILDIPRYDFNWQLVYRLREPLDLPKGARIHATGWYDNSPKNPANPDPRAAVRFGEQTDEEMMIGYFDWIPLPTGD